MGTVKYSPQRVDSVLRNDRAIPWTEQIARYRPKAPTRRLSASEEIGLSWNTARRQRPTIPDELRAMDRNRGENNRASIFGIPTLSNDPSRTSEALELTQGPGSFENMNGSSVFIDGGMIGDSKMAGNSIPPDDDPISFSPERRQRTLRFADEIGSSDDSDEEEPTAMDLDQRVRHAFAMHALNQAYGSGGLRNAFASSTVAAQEPNGRLRLTLRPRTLIYGHKAGLWLTKYTFESFCGLAEALMTHDWQTFGYPSIGGEKEFTVEVAGDNGTQAKEYQMALPRHKLHSRSKRTYETKILPILQGGEPKPRIRVRTAMNDCPFNCDCDDSRELEVEALDIGFLTILVEWHKWEDKSKSSINSVMFADTMFALLFPPPAFNDHDDFDIELPDGQTFHLVRGVGQLLSAEVQKQLSLITTRERQPGVKPRRIKLCPSNRLVLDRPQASPSQKSPSMARAEGTIFVHRPARTTLFRYDAPHTMERFFQLARSELYPDTDGELRLRISPSGAFRNRGELLTAISESKDGYMKPYDKDRALEEWWKQDIMENWLVPDEDVWVIQIFDNIRIFNGTQNDRDPEIWDTSALGDVAQGKDGVQEDWSVPPKSIMTELAAISKELLDIDPRKSAKGILLHVIRETPTGGKKEWLQWGPKQSFVQFMLEILYKIDGDAIAIYPGDHEESNDSTNVRMRETAEDMRRKRIENQAVKALYRRPSKPLFGALPSFDDDRGFQSAQSPLQSFSTAIGGFTQSLPANRSPGRNFFVAALSPSRRSATPDVDRLRRRLDHAEDEILLREESCKVCGMVFIKSSPAAEDAIREHYRSHAAPNPRSCPQKGCLENLEDRGLYPSHLAVTQHILSHGGLLQICSKPGCYCPLGLLTPKQCEEHIRLHPNTTFDRTRMRESSQEIVRGPATQPNPVQDYQEPKPKSNDSMNDKPGEHSKRLECDQCHHIMNELSETGRAAHARDCKTSVENFETIMVRPGKAIFNLNQEYVLQKYDKSKTKRRGKTIKQPTQTAAEDSTPASPPKPKGRAIRSMTKKTVRGGDGGTQQSTLQTVTEDVSTEFTANGNNTTSIAAIAKSTTARSGSVAPAIQSHQPPNQTTTSRTTRSGSAPASVTLTPKPPPVPPAKGRTSKTPAPSTATATTAASKAKPTRKPRATKAKPANVAGTGTSTPAPAEEEEEREAAETAAAAAPPPPKTRKPRAKKAKVDDNTTTAANDEADAPLPPPPKKPVRRPLATKKTKIPDSEGSATKAAATDAGNNDEQQPPPAPKTAAGRKARAKAKAKGKGKDVGEDAGTAAAAAADAEAGDVGDQAEEEEEGGETSAATAGAGKRKRKATVKAEEGGDGGKGKRVRKKK